MKPEFSLLKEKNFEVMHAVVKGRRKHFLTGCRCKKL